MLDFKVIRAHPGKIKKSLRNRSVDFDPDALLRLDEARRSKIKEADDLRAEHNGISERISRSSGSERERLIKESREMKMRLEAAERDRADLEERFSALLFQLPNIPFDDVPAGRDERDNVVVREIGKKPEFGFTPRDYMEIATVLDLIDTERAAKVSGSRFGYLKREAVLLEFALVQYAFDVLMRRGFIPVVPPVIIREEMMKGMGYIDFEKDREERYFLEKDKQVLVGTSEQSMVPMHADEILPEDSLPIRYVGFSTCFRREAGSYGKDTHGILRVHQFDKLEMVVFSTPGESRREHELMTQIEEELMQGLGIPYRVVALCAGDLSPPSAATFDVEAWLPGQNKGKGQYRETHSSSNTTDFQARRLGIKVRRKDGSTEFVHILNGTAFAIGRTIIAILENYQQEDGSVTIPEALRKYIGEIKVIRFSGRGGGSRPEQEPHVS